MAFTWCSPGRLGIPEKTISCLDEWAPYRRDSGLIDKSLYKKGFLLASQWPDNTNPLGVHSSTPQPPFQLVYEL